MAAQVPNKENLRKWVRALRSGAYEQGKGYMRSNEGYCCLGVAMDIAFANGVKQTSEPNWGKSSTMPAAVGDWYGIQRSNGHNDPVLRAVGGGPETEQMASSLNDADVPFGVIADRIVYTYGLDSDD